MGAYSTAETVGPTTWTVLFLCNRIKAAACHYAEIDSSEDREAACFLISQMGDMLEGVLR